MHVARFPICANFRYVHVLAATCMLIAIPCKDTRQSATKTFLPRNARFAHCQFEFCQSDIFPTPVNTLCLISCGLRNYLISLIVISHYCEDHSLLPSCIRGFGRSINPALLLYSWTFRALAMVVAPPSSLPTVLGSRDESSTSPPAKAR